MIVDLVKFNFPSTLRMDYDVIFNWSFSARRNNSFKSKIFT